jgi:peptidoglycan/xylan/chitin deacetylase (PgdA/CDA1 family)
MAQPLTCPAWPEGAEVAVSLTFDVDAESAYVGRDEFRDRLTTLSAARFSVARGLPRILDLLRDEGIPATFYVPGMTATLHGDAVSRIVAEGHEVAHHGHLHLRSHEVDADAQRREIEDGLAALDNLGIAPAGYRSPSWEVTPATFELLLAHGFVYDSSFMGDDRPYLEEHDGGSIVELPIHWSLDDFPYFGWNRDRGGNLAHSSGLLEVWLDELESARRDGRHVTYTMHPEIIGRGYRTEILRRFVTAARERARVWFVTHRDLAGRLERR